MLDYGMDTNYPASKTPDEFVKSVTDFQYDYDYQNVVQTYDDSLWGDLTKAGSGTGEFVWNTAKGTWETAKAGASKVANAVNSAGSSLVDTAFSFGDSLMWRMILIFAVIIAGLYVLGKSGIVKDVVSGILAVK